MLITIFDDETLPVVSFADSSPSVNESDGTLLLRANLSNASAQDASISYSTADLSATGGTGNGSGIDYVTISDQTLNFPAGSTYAEFPVIINQDSLNEGGETFDVIFSNANGVQFSGGSNSITATVSIVDDEIPILTAENLSPSFSERIGTANIGLNLSGPTSGDVEVTYTTSIISGVDNAESNDFTPVAISQTVTISASETTGVIPITINNDTTANEGDETFTVTMIFCQLLTQCFQKVHQVSLSESQLLMMRDFQLLL